MPTPKQAAWALLMTASPATDRAARFTFYRVASIFGARLKRKETLWRQHEIDRLSLRLYIHRFFFEYTGFFHAPCQKCETSDFCLGETIRKRG